MSHLRDILEKNAPRARAGERVEILVSSHRDRAILGVEARAYPDLELEHDRRLGVIVLKLRTATPGETP